MSSSKSIESPTFEQIVDAAGRLHGLARKTPLLENQVLNETLGFRLIIKPECLQRTGAFKFRGAYNKISQLPDNVRQRGVVAVSSGNHAQGVAAASTLFGIKSTLLMPSTAPQLKIDNTKALGGEVILYDPKTDDRELMAQEICASTNSSFVSPFDDPLIIAGQGTVGLEIARQSEHMGIKPDLVLVPAGGGGLAAGCAIAIKELIGCEIMSVEPDAFDDTKRSLETGVRQSVAPGGKTICDSLLPPMPGEITFSVNKRLLSGGVSVSDEEVLSAIKLAMLSFKVVAEPGGVVAVAAAVNGKYDAAGKTVVAIVSGGNIDPEMLSRALET
jgi:threonine dehydratase